MIRWTCLTIKSGGYILILRRMTAVSELSLPTSGLRRFGDSREDPQEGCAPLGKPEFTNRIDEVVYVIKDGTSSNIPEELHARHGIQVLCMEAEEVRRGIDDPDFQQELVRSIVIFDRPFFDLFTSNDLSKMIESSVRGVPNYTRLKEYGHEEVWELISVVAMHHAYPLANAAV